MCRHDIYRFFCAYVCEIVGRYKKLKYLIFFYSPVGGCPRPVQPAAVHPPRPERLQHRARRQAGAGTPAQALPGRQQAGAEAGAKGKGAEQ